MNNELYHFGVKGMKWGVRRQKKEPRKWATDKDGNPTYEAKRRYAFRFNTGAIGLIGGTAIGAITTRSIMDKTVNYALRDDISTGRRVAALAGGTALSMLSFAAIQRGSMALGVSVGDGIHNAIYGRDSGYEPLESDENRRRS